MRTAVAGQNTAASDWQDHGHGLVAVCALEWAELGSAIEGRSVASVSLEIWLVKLQVISGNPRDPRVNLGTPGCEIVPVLGGAFCACIWHFFYNSESLEVLVALQAALTVIGNATMCIAAFRIYRSSEERSKKL